MTRCWCGYLSRASCIIAYGPADATGFILFVYTSKLPAVMLDGDNDCMQNAGTGAEL